MILNVKILNDGSERVLIHWLIEDDKGPIETKPNVMVTERGPFKLGGVRGRIACNPEQNSVNPQHRGQEVLMCMHSNDVRAATCQKCLATDEAKALLAKYAEGVDLAA